ncbi:unnamed protein product [Sphagnum troendelagicum]|uniref:Uncharacterized protein n=1 Tax=Sphagnum troendelagicum TaxID=128251 RepID=A0ABP0U9Z1_9BRYO
MMSKQRELDLIDIGKKLANAQSKEALMNLLPQAASMLEDVEQSPPPSTIFAMKGCSDALVDPTLLGHKDKDVGVLVALCISEIMRIVAPDAPYSDDCLKEIFQLIVGIFRGLDDVHSPSFSSRVNILETVAKVRSCVVMLDLDCDDLITEMFEIFFTTISDKHPEPVFVAMRNVLSLVINEGEEVSSQILEVILNNLLRQKEGVSQAGHMLAVAVVEKSAEILEPYVQQFFSLAMSDGRGLPTALKKDYHELIYELYCCAPQMVQGVLPYLKEQLVSNQVPIRLKATILLGRMFSVPGRQVPPEYQQLFSEFLKRLNDEDVDVRVAAVNCAKVYLETTKSSTVETSEILVALGEQLCCFDDGVRITAMNAICNFARVNLNLSPPGILHKVADCLQDTKVSIRIETLHKLAGVYRSYCTKSFEGFEAGHDQFEWIPSKIFHSCYGKGSADFIAQDMEIVICEELFDAELLPVEEQAKHWVVFFSTFDEQDKIALRHILSQKQKLQLEMLVYLSVQQTTEEKEMLDFQRKIESSFTVISDQFVDPPKAKEDLWELHKMGDDTVFKELSILLDPSTSIAHARAASAELLKKIGENHPQHNFLKILTTKCAYSLFSREHAHAFIQQILVYRNSARKEQMTSTIDLLSVVAAYCPLLIDDVKENLHLLSKDDEEFIRNSVLDVISKNPGSSSYAHAAGSEVSSKLMSRSEELCMKEDCKQTKSAVAEITMTADSGLSSAAIYEENDEPKIKEAAVVDVVKKPNEQNGMKEEEKDGIEPLAGDNIKDPEGEVRDFEKDGLPEVEEMEVIGDGVKEKRELAAKDGLKDQDIDKVEENAEDSAIDDRNNNGVLAKNHEGDAVEKDLVVDDDTTKGDDFQDQEVGGLQIPEKGESEENQSHQQEEDLDLKEHGTTFDEDEKFNHTEDEKADKHQETVESGHKEVAADVTKEDETNKVTTEGRGLEKHDADETNEVTTEGTEGSRLEKRVADETNKVVTEGAEEGGGPEEQDADAANNVEDRVVGDEEKGLSEKEHDAGMSHEGRSEGREEDRVKDQVEDEIKDREETQAKMDPEEDGKDEEEGDGGVVPQKPDTQEDEDGKDEEEEDQEENQPAKRKHLPEDSSRNDPEEAGSLEESSKNHAVEVSSKDKDEEEVAVGVDHQDVEQMPTQTDKEGEEKDVVENLSAKRKAGRPKGSAAKNKRKLSVGDEKASESHEEALGPKHKRGRGHIESSDKKEIITEDGHPKSSGKKAITRKAGGDGKGREKEEQMEEEEGQTAKSKPGRPKSTGKKEIRSTAGIDVKTGQKHEEKNNINTPKTKTKPGRTKGSINKAVREVSSGDEKASSTDKGKEDLVGCGIKVWWPLDRRFYKGEVISYDAKKKRHKVLYDDGEQEILDLGVERWQLTTKKQRLMKVGSSCPMDGFVLFPILWPSLDLMKQQSSSKSGKKRVSQEGKSNNLEARFLKEKETPVKNTISEFDFDEDNDDDGEAPKGGKMKGKQVQSSSTSKGSSGKVFKHSVGDSSTEKPTTSRDSEGDAAAALSPDMSPGDGEPLNTWVIRRQKAH